MEGDMILKVNTYNSKNGCALIINSPITKTPKAFQYYRILLWDRSWQQLQNALLIFHIRTHNSRIWIVLQHPKLLELNILWHPATNKPFLLTYPQFIIPPYRAKWNKIRNPHQWFWQSSAILLPQLYGWVIFKVPQNISRRYFVLHHQPPYFVHKKLKEMHLRMTNKDV